MLLGRRGAIGATRALKRAARCAFSTAAEGSAKRETNHACSPTQPETAEPFSISKPSRVTRARKVAGAELGAASLCKKTANATKSIAPGNKSTTASDVNIADDLEIPRKSRKRELREKSIPPRLLASTSNKYNDLASFEVYTKESKLSTASNVYKGTHYEYTVAQTLQTFGFSLHRTGRSDDLGIDLIGHWMLPRLAKAHSRELRVLVQCKAAKPQPSMVRELEGAYVGAPAGWNKEDDVLALLVASKEATRGVREAVQRSTKPMGMLQITPEGEPKQFLWNRVAAQIGLKGLGVTLKYGDMSHHDSEKTGEALETTGMKETIALTWWGKLWNTLE